MTPAIARLSVFIPLVVMFAGVATAGLTAWQTMQGFERMVERHVRTDLAEDGRFLARETAAKLRAGEAESLERLYATGLTNLQLEHVALLDEEGWIVHAGDGSHRGRRWNDVPWLAEGLGLRAFDAQVAYEERSGNRLYGVTRVFTLPAEGTFTPLNVFILVVAVDLAPLLAEGQYEAARLALLESTTSLLLSAALAWILHRRLARRAGMLIRASESLGSPEFRRRPLPRGGDEIGRLSSSLQAMSGHLQATVTRITEDERRMQAVMDQSPQWIALCSPNGIVMHANRSLLDGLGLDERAVEGRALAEMITEGTDGPPPVWFESAIAEAARVPGSRAFRFQREVDGGGRRYFVASLSPVFDDDGILETILFEARDVTERERLFERLRVRESTLADALAQARLGTWEADPHDGTVQLSKEAQDIFEGAAPERFGARHFLREVHPDDRLRARRWMRAMASGVPQELLGLRLKRSRGGDGGRIVVNLRGTLHPAAREGRGIARGLVQDVTEQVRAQVSERNLLQLLDSVTSRLPGAIYRRTRHDDGRVHYPFLRGQLFRQLGIPDDEASLERMLQFVHPEDRSRLTSFVSQTSQSAERYEFRIVDGDGQLRWMAVLVEQHLDADGRPVADGFVLDVTEEKRTEEWMVRSKRLEAAAQLAGGVAHDFNNILAIIRGHAEFLAFDLESGEEADPAQVEAILRAVGRGESVTRRLLDMSRDDPAQTRVVDLCRHLPRFLETLGSAAAPGREILLDLQAPSAHVAVDLEELDNTLVNLITNARDASGDGGRIRILLEIRSEPLASQNGNHGPRPSVAVTVEDEGEGMDPETLERALDPFYTTKPPGRGTGLGLPSAFNFALRHEGDLRLDSAPGRGTRATLLFPLVAAAADDEETASAAAPPAWSGGRAESVLVVEDEEDLLPLLEQTLSERGCTVHTAADGHEALEVLEREDVDLLITDLVLPGAVSGHRLIEEMHARRPSVPVIVTSGYSSEMERLEDDERVILLRKPFAMSELAVAVERATRRPQSQDVSDE